MTFVSCSIPEQFVNPLFEVFGDGDFVVSSYRDIESALTEIRIFLDDPARFGDAKNALQAAMDIVGATGEIKLKTIADEDWKLAYRRHFKIDEIGERLVIVPEWEAQGYDSGGREKVILDPGMAFGTGKHETTRACLEYIEENATPSAQSFLDMGCGSGILAIAAAKLGFKPVRGFDVDQEAVDAARENAAKNEVEIGFAKFALGRAAEGVAPIKYDFVAANILGPLLIRFADEIVGYVGDKLVISGILSEIYPEVLAAYTSRGLKEISRKTLGEWTTGLMSR